MRQPVLISLFLFICLSAHAAQYPSSNDNAYSLQPINQGVSGATPTPAAIETYLSPYDNAETRFLQFLDQAKTRCYIASYSITAPSIINKLIQLHYRGIDVQVITDRTQAGGRREQVALAALQANGIPVYVGRSADNALMHCKLCVIDNHLTADGSYNFTTSANHEDNTLTFVDSRQRAEQFLAYWFRIRDDLR